MTSLAAGGGYGRPTGTSELNWFTSSYRNGSSDATGLHSFCCSLRTGAVEGLSKSWCTSHGLGGQRNAGVDTVVQNRFQKVLL